MFTRIEGLLRNITDRAFVLFLLTILVVRVGPSPIGEPWVNWVYDASEAFPKATSHISFSFLPVFLAKMFGEPPVIVWWSTFGLTLILWFLVVMNRLKTLFPNHYRIAQVVFASSQVVMLQTTFIGHYDNISVIAASLVFLWNSRWLVCVAAMAASGANPSMSFATGVCVLTLYFGTRNSYHFFAGIVYFLSSSVTLASLHFLLNAAPGLTREGIVLGELASVAKVSLGIWSFNFLSVLGPLWLVFAFLFFKETWSIGEISRLRRFWVFLGVIGIPMGMTFFIHDHTRLGVVVGFLPLFLFLLPELRKSFATIPTTNELKFPALSLGIIFWIMYPTVIVDTGGVFRLPYSKLIELISGGY